MRDFAERVKVYYERGLWNEARMKNAVKKGALSEDEYEAITGKVYTE